MKSSNNHTDRYVAPTVDVIEVVIEAGFADSPSGSTPAPNSGSIQPWDVDSW